MHSVPHAAICDQKVGFRGDRSFRAIYRIECFYNKCAAAPKLIPCRHRLGSCYTAQSALCLSSALKEPVPLSSFSFISASFWGLSPQVSAAALDFNVRLERTVVAGWPYGTGIDLVTCPITARSGGFLIEVRPSDRVLHATTRLFRSLAIREVSH